MRVVRTRILAAFMYFSIVSSQGDDDYDSPPCSSETGCGDCATNNNNCGWCQPSQLCKTGTVTSSNDGCTGTSNWAFLGVAACANLASVTPSISKTPSRTKTQTLTGSATQTFTRTQSPTGSTTQTLTRTQTPTGSATQTLTRTQTPTGSATQTLTGSRTPTSSQTQTASQTRSMTQVATQSQSTSQPGTVSQTLTHTASQTRTPSLTQLQTSSVTASQTQTLSQTQTQTATQSRTPLPFQLMITDPSPPYAPIVSVTISDSTPPILLALWLNRCPASDVAVECNASMGAQVWWSVAYSTGVGSVGGECALTRNLAQEMNGSSSVLLLAVVTVRAAFGTPALPRSDGASVICTVVDASPPASANIGAGGTLLASAQLPLTVLSSLWPLSDDIIALQLLVRDGDVVGSTLRSTRTSAIVRVNATNVVVGTASEYVAAAFIEGVLVLRAGPEASLYNVSLGAVLASARSQLGGQIAPPSPLLGSSSATAALSLTLLGPTALVLRSHLRGSFSNSTSIWLGGLPCVIGAVSEDGYWLALLTPSAELLCGEASLAAATCGYVSLHMSTPALPAAADPDLSLGTSLSCPPFCPRALASGIIPLPFLRAAAASVSANATVASVAMLPAVLGTSGLDIVQPGAAGSGGFIYYAVACSATGLYTDPSTGACANASDPLSLSCAFGSGADCVLCPSGGLCPGGARLWPKPGFWVAAESSGAVLPCLPPYPHTRCPGWSVDAGAAMCGEGYLQGSYRCDACARGYFAVDDGTCAACPVITGPWDRFRGLLQLLLGVIACVCVVFAALALTIRVVGGTIVGATARLVSLIIWSVTTVQVVSQVARVSSVSLPPILRAMYRAVAVIQLEGIVLPPACTGAYLFETEVAMCSCTLVCTAVAVCVYYLRRSVSPQPVSADAVKTPKQLTDSVASSDGSSSDKLPSRMARCYRVMAVHWSVWVSSRYFSLLGRCVVTGALVLFPATATSVLSLLDCASVGLPIASMAGLDGGAAWLSSRPFTVAAGVVDTRILASNPFVVCWVEGGSHRPAGALAAFTFIAHVIGFPVIMWVWLSQQKHWGRWAATTSAMLLRSGQLVVGYIQHNTRHSITPSAATDKKLPLQLTITAPAPTHPSSVVAADPLLAPFLADYRPTAWYTKHLDLGALFVLSALQAFLPRPTAAGAVAGKVIVTAAVLLPLCVWVALTRPFLAQDAWKGHVRVLLLILSVSCAAMNASASAFDAAVASVAAGGGSAAVDPGGTWASSISAGAYLIFTFCVITATVLVVGFGRAMLYNARSEQRSIQARAAAAPAASAEADERERDQENAMGSVNPLFTAAVLGVRRGQGRVLSYGVGSVRHLNSSMSDGGFAKPISSVKSNDAHTVHNSLRPNAMNALGSSSSIRNVLLFSQVQRSAHSPRGIYNRQADVYVAPISPTLPLAAQTTNGRSVVVTPLRRQAPGASMRLLGVPSPTQNGTGDHSSSIA